MVLLHIYCNAIYTHISLESLFSAMASLQDRLHPELWIRVTFEGINQSCWSHSLSHTQHKYSKAEHFPLHPWLSESNCFELAPPLARFSSEDQPCHGEPVRDRLWVLVNKLKPFRWWLYNVICKHDTLWNSLVWQYVWEQQGRGWRESHIQALMYLKPSAELSITGSHFAVQACLNYSFSPAKACGLVDRGWGLKHVELICPQVSPLHRGGGIEGTLRCLSGADSLCDHWSEAAGISPVLSFTEITRTGECSPRFMPTQMMVFLCWLPFECSLPY